MSSTEMFFSLDQAFPDNHVWSCWNLSKMQFFGDFKSKYRFPYVPDKIFEKCTLPNIKKSHVPTTFVSMKVDESEIIHVFLCCLLSTSVPFCPLLSPSVHFCPLLSTSKWTEVDRRQNCAIRNGSRKATDGRLRCKWHSISMELDNI